MEKKLGTSGIIGIILGLYRDNGKGNGNYRDFRDYGNFHVMFWNDRWICVVVPMAFRTQATARGPYQLSATWYGRRLNPKS